MNSNSSLTQQYFSWILNKYNEFQQYKQNQEAYRIVDIIKDKFGNYSLNVQVTGKSTFFTCTPDEIVTNDHLLEGFSKKDIRSIVYYAAHESKKPGYSILIQEFCFNLNKMIFRLVKRGTMVQIKKTANQISLDNNIIKNLKPEDAHLIGFTTASEQFTKDKEEMEKLKCELKNKPE